MSSPSSTLPPAHCSPVTPTTPISPGARPSLPSTRPTPTALYKPAPTAAISLVLMAAWPHLRRSARNVYLAGSVRRSIHAPPCVSHSIWTLDRNRSSSFGSAPAGQPPKRESGSTHPVAAPVSYTHLTL